MSLKGALMVKGSKRTANLTVDRAVKSLKWVSGDPIQYEVKSEGHPGFYIRISKGGTRTWIYRYTFKGQVQRLPLGHYPSVGCAKAFSRYEKARKQGHQMQLPSKEFRRFPKKIRNG